MCGRARLAEDHSETKIRAFLEGVEMPNIRPCYNLAPTMDILGVTATPAGVRSARMMHWGIIPHWATEKKMKFPTFNARGEELLEKKTYAPLWNRAQRCLVVVDGFYEWRKPDKQPFTIVRRDGEPMVFGGLWGDWKDKASGETIRTCTIITMASEGTPMADLHDRVPFVLEPRQWADWLGETRISDNDAYDMIRAPGDVLKWWPVDKAVGNIRNQGAHLAEPVDL